jgi:GxxExxY protein
MDRIKNENLLHSELSGKVIGCCIELIRELGSGFLENVYKNALYILMTEKGLKVSTEKTYEVNYRGYKIGRYNADIIVEDLLIVELKCCPTLVPAHQAKLINYLKVAKKEVGLLVNFGNQKLEYKRLHYPGHFNEEEIPKFLS